MTDHEKKEAINALIYLCSCAINETDPDKEKIASLNLHNLYKVSHEHMLTAICGKTLQKTGIIDQDFKNAVALAQRKAVILSNEFSIIASSLDTAKIWYMPIKGAVIKELYPNFAMREMTDYDVLFDASKAKEIREIMEGLGFRTDSFGYQNVDDYRKPPVSNFEMHRTLFGKQHDERFYEYYRDIKHKLINDSGCRFSFTPEDSYIYMIAHEYKHYSVYGTGLRSLLDTYVFLTKNQIDMDYVATETEKLGIEEFEKQNRCLALTLFNGDAVPEEYESMFSYVLSSGTYGKFNHKIENILRRDGDGKLQYLRRRILGPIRRNDIDRKRFMERYEVFFRYPILLPLLPFYRLFRAMRRTPNRISAEVTALRKARKRTM